MTNTKINNFTLKQAQEIVKNNGFKDSACDWENEEHIYAFSREIISGTYGHPKFEVHFDKTTKWLSII